jgi:multiple sugar transport system ATP-binding protein
MSEVRLNHIYKVYDGGVRAVNDFTLDVKNDEFVVFVGPSGCGKSTTLRMIAGLENITSGGLYIDDVLVNDVDSKDRDIAMVFQNYALYPHMTVFQNMAFGLRLRHLPPKEIEERVNRAAEILEITDLLTRKPKALSGGQCQRVALGRAIVREPKVFLLDEPLSNLDAKLRVQMRTEITKLHKRLATTFIYVTHDQTEAMTMGDRIVVMNKGFIQQVDTPVNLYENPTNLFVATFLGSPQMNIIDCKLAEKGDRLVAYLHGLEKLEVDFPELKAKELSEESYIGQEMLLGLRPEHIRIAEAGIPAEIDVIEQLGDETIVYAKIEGGDDNVLVKGAATGQYNPKDKIFLSFEMGEAHLFDKRSGNSVMDVPRVNRLFCHIGKDAASVGKNVFVYPSDYKERLLETAFESKKTYLCFAPKDVGLAKKAGAFRIACKVGFVVKKTDCLTVFLTSEGIGKYIVTSAGLDSGLKKGDAVSLYVAPKDIYFEDEEGNRLISKERILPNLAKASIVTRNGKSVVSFGGNKVAVPDLGVPDGEHTIRLKETGCEAILGKKDAKKIGRKNPAYDKSRAIKVSAYDEDLLGSYNAAFVQVSGLEDYATFLLPADFSVYKAPSFTLALGEDSIKVEK